MKAIRIFRRNIGNAVKSIFRNFSLSIASVMCTTITLVIVALALVFSANVNNFTKDIEKTLTILVFVDKNATEEDISTIKSSILEIKNIKSDELIYKDKETLKEETMKKNSEDAIIYTIMEGLTPETNFLESEFILSVKNINELEQTVSSLKTIDKVSRVRYSQDVVEKMIPVFNVVERVTWVIIIGLIIVTIFLICNTIKLTIFARRSEIEIMRLVGTSNFVIKLPFVIEGLFLGAIGSIIPIVATIWGYIFAFEKLEGHLFTNFITMLAPIPFSIYVSGILLIIGTIVGMFGSYITVRRYLKI